MGLQVELGGGELGPVGAPVGPPENHLGRSVEERRSSGGFWPTCALEVSEDLGKAGELRPDLWGVVWENKGLEFGYGVTV